jgi:hypothetical protein
LGPDRVFTCLVAQASNGSRCEDHDSDQERRAVMVRGLWGDIDSIFAAAAVESTGRAMGLT